MSRNSNIILWDYFEKDPVTKYAKCNYCKGKLSYKTTITNLKQHLKLKHKSVFQNYVARARGLRKDLHQDDINEAKAVQDRLKQESEIRSYYETEVGGWQRCVICRTSRSSDLNDLVEHLKEKHPKLLLEIEQISDSESDNGDHSENTYTEVVYLDDEVKVQNKKAEQLVCKNRQKPEKTPRKSNYFEEADVKPQTAEEEELESFVKYITCLLKQVPKDTFGKLQMDIVNLIMNAKLNSNATHNSVLYENIIQNMENIHNVPALNSPSECQEQSYEKNIVTVPRRKVTLNNIPVTSTITGTYVRSISGEKNSDHNLGDS